MNKTLSKSILLILALIFTAGVCWLSEEKINQSQRAKEKVDMMTENAIRKAILTRQGPTFEEAGKAGQNAFMAYREAYKNTEKKEYEKYNTYNLILISLVIIGFILIVGVIFLL